MTSATANGRTTCAMETRCSPLGRATLNKYVSATAAIAPAKANFTATNIQVRNSKTSER
jgi:hypothetical protein